MAASDARPIPLKNTAYRVYLPILDADGDLVTGAAGLDSEVSIDGAAFADCTNEATEIGSSGVYHLDLTAGEMNGDAVVVIVKTSTSGAKTSPLIFYPQEADDIRVSVTHFGGTAGTFASGRPEVRLADGVTHGGTTALVTLNKLTIANGAGDAVLIQSTGGNGNGALVEGNGTGNGMFLKGGATGNGLRSQGGATSGHGGWFESNDAASTGDGLRCQSRSADGDGMNAQSEVGAGIYAEGGTSGPGIAAIGANHDDGHGIFADAGGGNAHGILSTGSGTGRGVLGVGGATGNGIQGTGGATSGHGIVGAGTTSGGGNGIYATGDNGIAGEGYGATGSGIYGYADVNGDGLAGYVNGTGKKVSGVSDYLSSLPTKTAAVVDDAGNSATTFKTDLTESANDHYAYALLKFTSGSLAEQVRKITAYNGTTKFVTVETGFTAEPADGDDFEIIND